MIVMGIDPGSRKTGYGVISQGTEGFHVHGSGLIRPDVSKSMNERIWQICTALEELIASMRPECVAVETAFLGRNVRSALILGQVRGAVLATAMRCGVTVREYAPREVKLSVTGSGSAGKEQVAAMLSRLLELGDEKRPLDVTDALGIAYCDLSRNAGGVILRDSIQGRGKKSRKQGWSAFIDDHPELVA
ncbi:MAG: crossover junction endodeoxyribonuclease RuvC [Chlorobiaceae bacterium]|nr:crossover junction endodeoxyribonuclease RuvC [Chlorobiaceae bacterium]